MFKTKRLPRVLRHLRSKTLRHFCRLVRAPISFQMVSLFRGMVRKWQIFRLKHLFWRQLPTFITNRFIRRCRRSRERHWMLTIKSRLSRTCWKKKYTKKLTKNGSNRRRLKIAWLKIGNLMSKRSDNWSTNIFGRPKWWLIRVLGCKSRHICNSIKRVVLKVSNTWEIKNKGRTILGVRGLVTMGCQFCTMTTSCWETKGLGSLKTHMMHPWVHMVDSFRIRRKRSTRGKAPFLAWSEARVKKASMLLGQSDHFNRRTPPKRSWNRICERWITYPSSREF